MTVDAVVTSGTLYLGMPGIAFATPSITTTGSQIRYFVNTYSSSLSWGASSSSFNGSIDNLSAQQVTAPSSSGCTIVSAKAGETYNFSYKNASFTYNAASYYCIIKKIR